MILDNSILVYYIVVMLPSFSTQYLLIFTHYPIVGLYIVYKMYSL